MGAAGTAFGMGLCGWLLEFLLKTSQWDKLRAYRVIFWMYAGFGLVIFGMVLCLSKACEIERPPQVDIESASVESGKKVEGKKNFFMASLPSFSRQSKFVVIKLCLLFALESFGSNMAPL